MAESLRVDDDPSPETEVSSFAARHHRGLQALAAGAAYLLVGVVLWWHVWSTHPTVNTTCGCGDPALFLWFLQWPAHAIATGQNPFYSTALFHPHGINLLSNTSVLAIGIPLAPVTWIFGPVATLNVASTLVPALSALAAYWALRRFVPWGPAAFVGGLLYGFSPFVLSNLQFAHLMAVALPVLPLILVCLDEILVRQRFHPIVGGVALALLATVQFFLSTEILVLTVIMSVVGTGLVLIYGLGWARAELRQRLGRACVGLVTGGVVGVALLAYPTWFALAGPAHISGRIWDNIDKLGGFEPQSFVSTQMGREPPLFQILGGYGGSPLPSSAYLGWGLLAVIVVGAVIWHRDKRIWFFGSMAVTSGALSLLQRKGSWVPWQLFSKLPVLDDIVQQRFVAVTYLMVAGLLAVILQRTRALALPDRWSRRAFGAHWSPRGRRLVPIAATVGLTAIALLPIALAFAPVLPYVTRPVNLPEWYAEVAPHLPPQQVLLAYPAPFSGIQSSMAWQAVNTMHYDQAGGGGPQGVPKRAGAEEPGYQVLAALGFGLVLPPPASARNVTAVRAALAGWKVTMVVIANQPGLAATQRGRDPVYAAAFMTAAIGRPPTYSHGAWVWRHVDVPTPALVVAPGAVFVCGQAGDRHAAVAMSAPTCVANHARSHAEATPTAAPQTKVAA